LPLLDGVPIAVERGDAWLNLASICKHSTTPAEGPGYRSAISFGFQIGEQRGRELELIHREWLAKVGDEFGMDRTTSDDAAAANTL
jgi:hypothetical protein